MLAYLASIKSALYIAAGVIFALLLVTVYVQHAHVKGLTAQLAGAKAQYAALQTDLATQNAAVKQEAARADAALAASKIVVTKVDKVYDNEPLPKVAANDSCTAAVAVARTAAMQLARMRGAESNIVP